MSFVITCGCGKKFRVKDESVGKRGRCPGCGTVMALNPPAPEPAGDALDSVDWDAIAAAESRRPQAAPRQAAPPQRAPAYGAPAPLPPPPPSAPMYYAPTPPPGAQRPCPACGQFISPFAHVCEFCGASPNQPATTRSRGRGPRSQGDVTAGDILAAPFGANLFADAVMVVLGYIGWAIVCAVVFVVCALLGGQLPFVLGFVVVLVPPLAVIVVALGWIAQKFFAVAEQYESGSMIASTDRSRIACLGMFTLVMIIAYGIAFLGVIPAIITRTPELMLLVLVSCLAAVLYYPMAMGMAGAYGIINPARVVSKIIQAFPMYLLVLCFIIVLSVVVWLLQVGILLALVAVGANMQPRGGGPPVLLPAIAGLISGILGAYGVFGMMAMLGLLLRKYPEPNERSRR